MAAHTMSRAGQRRRRRTRARSWWLWYSEMSDKEFSRLMQGSYPLGVMMVYIVGVCLIPVWAPLFGLDRPG